MSRKRKPFKGYFSTVIIAIIGIVVLDGIALAKGIDGVILMTSLSIIGGLAGYEVRKHHKK